MADTTQQEFLKDLDIKPDDKFEQPLTEAEPAKEEAEEEGFNPKNRRERRLLEQNQRLREEAIANAARLDEISKARKAGEGSETSELRKLIEPLYGTDTPEKIAATDLLEKAFARSKELAKEEYQRDYEERESKASEEAAKEDANVEDILDRASDLGINIDNDTERIGFITLLEKLSPKDKDGNITEYADAEATAELYLDRKEKPSNRAKELASRSMTRSGQGGGSKLEADSNERWLKDNGII